MNLKTMLGNWLRRISSSDVLIRLKWALFTMRRMQYTANWKYMFAEAELAIKQPAWTARLFGRVDGEVRYA